MMGPDWIPYQLCLGHLAYGRNGFYCQEDVLIEARRAGDTVGADKDGQVRRCRTQSPNKQDLCELHPQSKTEPKGMKAAILSIHESKMRRVTQLRLRLQMAITRHV